MAGYLRGLKKDSSNDRVRMLDNDFIITKRVEKGLKRWKFLQTEIQKKQRKVEKGARSKRLEPYKKERDGLVEQMQKDIPELQSIFYDEYSNAFDRKDKRCTTTGDMRKENRETLRQLRDNNPNTVELSDPNRPTKLSEQFSDLYDKEWTDAFDELGELLDDKEEKQIIFYLRDFVLEIHSVCSDLSFSKMKTIEEAFVKPSVPSENTKLPTKILTTIKDGIKSMAPNLLEYTRELVLGRLEEKYLMDPVAGCLQHQNVKRYIDRCTEVCWYMSVQDPQLFMDGSKSPDDKFDSNKYREYTKKGPYEEFVVWPVLYLYRGGPMLSRGVAHRAKKEMIGSKSIR